jgi:transposase
MPASCANSWPEGRLPEAWLPPAHVRGWRTRTRLRKTLLDERTQWQQRIQATLFHHGVPAGSVPRSLLSAEGRRALAELQLPEAARERIQVALALIDALDARLAPLERKLRQLARRQTGCRALQRHFGIGPLTAPTILVELGDVTRLSASRKPCAPSASTSASTAQPSLPPGEAHPSGPARRPLGPI